MLDLLGVKDHSQLSSCLVIGYPDVKYNRTVPRKEAVVTLGEDTNIASGALKNNLSFFLSFLYIS